MRWLIAALIAFGLAAPAAAEERVRDFASDIVIAKDGTIDVTETIRVQVDHVAINHGIFREIPTRYQAPWGKRVRVGFTLLETTLDGRPEPYASETMSNGVRIKIGDADRIVPIGIHVYTIRYQATRMLGRFDGYDELYWNVTGNGWRLPIDRASVTITLPSAAAFGKRAAYTGYKGDQGSAAMVAGEGAGRISFATTAPLEPGQGLSVAAAFPTGVVDAPSSTTRAGWWLADWAPPLVALGGLAALIGFLYVAWARAGRDPRAGTVVPIFAPPDGLSPAAMRYVIKQSLDNRGFAAALVDAAVKGHVRLIDEDGGLFGSDKRSIERPVTFTAQPLDVAEQAAIDGLVAPGETLAMDNDNHARFSSANNGLSKTYAKRFEGVAFNRNLSWAFAAVGVWLLALLLTAIITLWFEGVAGSSWFLLSPMILLVVILVWTGLPTMSKWTGFAVHGVLVVIGGLAALGSLPAIPMALAAGRWVPIAIAGVGLPLALSAFAWIDAPTKAGRAILDRVAGFKQYLSITERERLDRMQAPEDNLQLFERFLPYAIALEVRTAGPTASPRCWPRHLQRRRRRAARRGLPGIRDRRAPGPTLAGLSGRSASHCRARCHQPRPRRDRRADRAAADRRVAAAVAVVAAAGDQPVGAGRRTSAIGSPL